MLALEVRDGRVDSARYPDALGRVWSALRCRTAGEVLARRGPAGSSSTGAARTTSAAARTARCTPTTPSARCCGAGRARDRPRARAVDAPRHRPDGPGPLRPSAVARGVSVSRDAVRHAVRAGPALARRPPFHVKRSGARAAGRAGARSRETPRPRVAPARVARLRRSRRAAIACGPAPPGAAARRRPVVPDAAGRAGPSDVPPPRLHPHGREPRTRRADATCARAR